MGKIKVVQIACYATENEWDTKYLDDKGRVWYDAGHMERSEEGGQTKSRWVTVWKQVELPEEPEY